MKMKIKMFKQKILIKIANQKYQTILILLKYIKTKELKKFYKKNKNAIQGNKTKI